MDRCSIEKKQQKDIQYVRRVIFSVNKNKKQGECGKIGEYLSGAAARTGNYL